MTLDELEKLYATGTPGPWVRDNQYCTIIDAEDVAFADVQSDETAQLIVAMRTMLPSLITELRALRKANEQLIAVVERLQKEQEEGYVFIRISDALAALEGGHK